MKHNIINALIILVIFAIAIMFGTLLVESKLQATHAVTGAYGYDIGGIIFLTCALSCIAIFTSYFAIKVRNDDLALKLKSEQRYNEFLAKLNKI